MTDAVYLYKPKTVDAIPMICKKLCREEAEKTYLGDLLYTVGRGMYKDYPLKPYSDYRKHIRNTEISTDDVGQTVENMITAFLPKKVNHETI